MKINFLIAADYVNRTAEGKLNVMGVFGEIRAAQLPVGLSFHLIMQLCAEHEDYDKECPVSVRLINPDGMEFQALEGAVRFPSPADGVPSQIDLDLVMQNIRLEMPGPYEVAVKVNDVPLADLTILVRRITSPN